MKLERLARIELDDEEREKLLLQLPRILNVLRRLDVYLLTEGGEVPGGREVTGAPLADDEPAECLDTEEVLSQAPSPRMGQFSVPSVIDSSGKGS